MAIFDDITATIGDTPVVRLRRIAPAHVTLYAKVESFNPGGSVKDRLALAIVLDAERKGRLKPGDTVVEATSGNTGIALAMVCAARGYRFVAVMSDSFSMERRRELLEPRRIRDLFDLCPQRHFDARVEGHVCARAPRARAGEPNARVIAFHLHELDVAPVAVDGRDDLVFEDAPNPGGQAVARGLAERFQRGERLFHRLGGEAARGVHLFAEARYLRGVVQDAQAAAPVPSTPPADR